MDISRRQFVIITLATTGMSIGLASCRVGKSTQTSIANGQVHAGSVLTLTADNRLLLIQDKMEMGQGIATATAALVATELGIAPDAIELVSASPGVTGGNPHYIPSWGTGGSSSIRSSWQGLRTTGGLLRHLLLEAAARAWQQPLAQLQVKGTSIHSLTDGKSARFSALIPHIDPADSESYVPPQTPLHSGSYNPIHQRAMCTGAHLYSSDVVIDDMSYAVLLRNADTATVLPPQAAAAGIKAVHISNGIALVGKRLWQLLQVRGQLQSQLPPTDTASGADQALLQALDRPGVIGRTEGRSMPQSAPALRVEYTAPFLAHAAMEPLSCIVSVRPDHCQLWLGTQRPVDARQTAARICGLPQSAVQVHTYPMGGSFGRRLVQDYVREAVELGKQLQQPVKLVWTREDDMRHGVYRTAAAARMQAWFDAENHLAACSFRVATADGHAKTATAGQQDRRAQWQTRLLGHYRSNHGALAGLTDASYQFGHWRAATIKIPATLHTGAWRSVQHSYNAFFLECFVDELAAHTGTDPVSWRLDHLPPDDGLIAVLTTAARIAGWPDAGTNAKFGVAVHRSFGTNVALIARVSGNAGTWQVTDLVCAVECGQVVNEDGVLAQVEGGLLYGLSAALYGAITTGPDGAVVEGNFDRYRVLRMLEQPRIRVEIVRTARAPSGMGEPAVPVVAPAVANAVAALTGIRQRALPLK